MKLHRVRLHNYRQHGDLDVKVSGTMIGVEGHNGAGKSNFLKAIQFAFTGEDPGSNKSDLLKWGEKTGYVEVEFEHDGHDGKIVRQIHSTKVSLSYDGTETSGASNVAKELTERLGLDKDLLRQAVFVRQTEVDAIISAKTDKREREVAFQKLIGVDAAKVHKTLTDWMYANARSENFDVQLAENVQRLEDMRRRASELEELAAKAEEKRASAVSVDTEELAKLNGYKDMAVRLDAKRSELSFALTARESAESSVGRAEAYLGQVMAEGEIEPCDVDAHTLYQEVMALREEIEKGENLARVASALCRARGDVRDADAMPHFTPEELGASEQKAAEVSAECAVKSSSIGIREKTLELMHQAGGGTCPVCGSVLNSDLAGSIASDISRLKAELGELQRQGCSLVEQIRREKVSNMAWSAAKAKADAALASAEEAFAAAEEPVVDIAAAKAAMSVREESIARRKAYDAAVEAKKAVLKAAESSVASARVELDMRREAVARISQEVADLEAVFKTEEFKALIPVETDDYSSVISAKTCGIMQRMSELERLKLETARCSAAQEEVERTISNLEQTVEKLRAAQEEQEKRRKALAVLDRVREWFHYANGPRALTAKVMAALTDDVNRFLSCFTAPFVVMPDPETIGFRVEFTDGRTMPETPPDTDCLSGGERIQLAVAFRLAIYCMFAGRLGLLSLDEPTAYLDDGNVDRFGLLLQKVKGIAREMDVQVLMATHEKSVMPFMDSMIAVG